VYVKFLKLENLALFQIEMVSERANFITIKAQYGAAFGALYYNRLTSVPLMM
jgi:hypothetical protein